jgi:hypothetical protein
MGAQSTGVASRARRGSGIILATFACALCLLAMPQPSLAVEGKPFGIASFAMQTTRALQPAHGVGAFIEEPYSFTQAGGRPEAISAVLQLDSEEVGEEHRLVPNRDLKDVTIDMPPGLAVSPQAAARCPLVRALSNARCPSSTQVGTYAITAFGGNVLLGPIVDVTPEAGQAAELALVTSDFSIPATGRLVRTPPGYGLALVAAGLPLVGLTSMEVTLWGVPAAESHDPQRGLFCAGGPAATMTCEGGGEPAGATPAPFLAMPGDCAGGPLTATVHADSWQEPGRWAQASATLPAPTGCGLTGFAPTLQASPETPLADEPLGLSVEVRSALAEGVQEPATPPLRQATVTLPQGVSIDPALAGGVRSCPARGPEGIDIPSGLSAAGQALLPEEAGEGEELGPDGLKRLAPGHCPAASAIGSAEVRTPLVAHPLQGRVYLAQPGCGAAGQPECTRADAAGGSLYRLYAELGGAAEGASAEAGSIVKLEGRVQANPATGQLTVTIAEAPQLPIEDLRISLNGGPRALLASPPGCARATTSSNLTPWSAPGLTPEGLSVSGAPEAAPSSFYEVSGCEASRAFAPGLLAGTIDPAAGSSSAFTASIAREDREPYLGQIQLRLPAGVSAQLAGVPLCGEAAANAGSCAAVSRIGGSTIAAGAGSDPLQMSGSVYLTQGYGGAPFGLAIVTDAVAGPLNLGRVVLRARVNVDPQTAAITITTDPLPQILLGVPLRLRRIGLEIDRPDFILNPTGCGERAVSATILSSATGAAGGSVAQAASPFAAAGCTRLLFTPQLGAQTRGNGRFGGHGASLAFSIAMPSGQANLRTVRLSLPKRLPARGSTIRHACTQEAFEGDPAACPKASVVGYARAQTPILAGTLLGPVYLIAKARGARDAFPELEVVLQADGVRIDLTGQLYVSARNVTSASFEGIPDIPIRHFELVLPEGARSMLSAGASLCKSRSRLKIQSTLTAQNGARVQRAFGVAVSGCGGRRGRKPAPARHPRPVA